MKTTLLFLLVVLFTIGFSLECRSSDLDKQQSIQKISTLDIKPALSLAQYYVERGRQEVADGHVSTFRGKISSTLRKPLTKKWRSRNWNLC